MVFVIFAMFCPALTPRFSPFFPGVTGPVAYRGVPYGGHGSEPSLRGGRAPHPAPRRAGGRRCLDADANARATGDPKGELGTGDIPLN